MNKLPEPASVLDLLEGMISFDTVNSNISGIPAPEKPMADAIRALAASWGFTTQVLPVHGEQANLLLTCEIDPEKPWLLLESHMDTVSVNGMSIAPFTPHRTETSISGRGSCDTKASGAAMLWSLKTAFQNGTLANNTAMLFSVDEEVGKTGIETFVRHHLPTLPWKPLLALVGEPTRLAPVIANNGAVRWKILTSGIAAHSSTPAKGQSAISAMVRVIDKLEKDYIPQLSAFHPLTGKAQCSINQIHGGIQANMIPDSCEIVIDRRLVPGENPKSILPEVEEHLDELHRRFPLIWMEQKDAFFDPPLVPLRQEDTLAFLRPSLEKLGLSCEPQGVPYGTDAANLAAAGIPAIVIGPGDIAQAHTRDEWVSIAEVERAVSLFSSLLETPLFAPPPTV